MACNTFAATHLVYKSSTLGNQAQGSCMYVRLWAGLGPAGRVHGHPAQLRLVQVLMSLCSRPSGSILLTQCTGDRLRQLSFVWNLEMLGSEQAWGVIMSLVSSAVQCTAEVGMPDVKPMPARHNCNFGTSGGCAVDDQSCSSQTSILLHCIAS